MSLRTLHRMAPQLVFDPARQRWVVVAFEDDGRGEARHVGLLARSVSDSGLDNAGRDGAPHEPRLSRATGLCGCMTVI